MDFFQDLGWQPQPAKRSFGPHENHLRNGFNGFVGSAFVVAEHKPSTIAKSPSVFNSFEDAQYGSVISVPHHNSESNESDDDFGDFESVPAVTPMAAEKDNSPEWVPPLPASQLMLQAHGAALPAALQPCTNSVDPSASLQACSGPLESKIESAPRHTPSVEVARSACVLDTISIASAVGTTKSTEQIGGSLSDLDDTDWGDFVQPSVTMGTKNVSHVFLIDPKPTVSGSWASNMQKTFSGKQTIERGIAGLHAATFLTSPRIWGITASSKSSNLSLSGEVRADVSTLATPKHPDNDDYKKAKLLISRNCDDNLGDAGANSYRMEKSGNGTRGLLNDISESIVTGDHQNESFIEATTNSISNRPGRTCEKLSVPIPLSVFGDNEEPSFRDDEFVFHGGNSEKELMFKPQSTSHKRSVTRSMSSSSIPSETFSSYIASLYTQSNGSHHRRHSSSTVISNLADAEDRAFGTSKLLDLGSQDAEIDNQQELKGFNSKQVKGILEDEAELEVVSRQIAVLASIQDQLAYMEAWNALASVCASELAHGRALWQSAKLAGMCSSLISHSQGRSYFVSLGQVHAVYLILEAAVLQYRPWLEAVSDQGKEVKAALKRCQTDWSDLKDAVYSAILEFEGRSALLSSWESLERISSIGEASDIISYKQECQALCRLSLLPLHNNFGVPAVKWGEYHYFLPLANLWANCVSMKPPQLPQILSKA